MCLSTGCGDPEGAVFQICLTSSIAVFFSATTVQKKKNQNMVLLLVPVSMETEDMLADEQASKRTTERENICTRAFVEERRQTFFIGLEQLFTRL